MGDAPGFKDHFSSTAKSYAAHRPRYPLELADVLRRLSPSTQAAWDCGCGSGQLSTVLAQRFERVEATDASAEQVAHATPHPRVHYTVARAEASGLPGGSMDLCVAAQAAHWFDLGAYYAEVQRVAKPGALVALVSYALLLVDERVYAVVNEYYDGPLKPYWNPERALVDSGYATLPFPFEPVEAPQVDMPAEWSLEQLNGYFWTWSAVRNLEKAEGLGGFHDFLGRVAQAWGDAATTKPVRWPLSLRLGRCPPGAGSV